MTFKQNLVFLISIRNNYGFMIAEWAHLKENTYSKTGNWSSNGGLIILRVTFWSCLLLRLFCIVVWYNVSLWVVVDRCVGRCGSLWLVPGFSNYGFQWWTGKKEEGSKKDLINVRNMRTERRQHDNVVTKMKPREWQPWRPVIREGALETPPSTVTGGNRRRPPRATTPIPDKE